MRILDVFDSQLNLIIAAALVLTGGTVSIERGLRMHKSEFGKVVGRDSPM